MNQLVAALKVQLSPLFDTELVKLAAVGSTAFGAVDGNHWMTVASGAAYLVIHFLDSAFNSPAGTKPA